MSPLSLNPTDAEERPVDNREKVTVMEAFTEMTDYGGRIEAKVPVMTLVFRTKGGTKRERSYSAGSAEHVVANKDATGFDAVGESKGMPAGCNTVAFLQSLVAAGFPAEELAGGDISCIVGLELVIMEVDQPQRFAPRPKPKLGPGGVPVKDPRTGRPVMEPPPPPKRFWLVSEIVGVEPPQQQLPMAPPPGPVQQRSQARPAPAAAHPFGGPAEPGPARVPAQERAAAPPLDTEGPFKHPDIVAPPEGGRAIDDDDIPFGRMPSY